MATIEEARRQLMQLLNQDDRFCRCNEIQLTSIGEGCAEAEMPMSEKHLNGLGFAQGGATFTLADLAFAGAANSHGRHAVAMVSNISFLRPGAGRQWFGLLRKARFACWKTNMKSLSLKDILLL